MSALSRPLLRRFLHQSNARRAITNLEMPAMSPTMTEGGIAGWKKKDGESFVAGDVLLEIETDKATIDVEAQDDGIMGKILVPDGSKNIVVGKVIALLAEEGDDISNLQPPKEETSPRKQQQRQQQVESSASAPPPAAQESKSTPPPVPQHSSTPPSHSRPLFPSVHRLLMEHNISKPSEIKGTGVRGMLTKGDVLAFLGKASGPTGTYKEAAPAAAPAPKKEEYKPLDGPALRRLIVSTMLQNSVKARNPPPTYSLAHADFDAVIADYLPPTSPELKSKSAVVPPPPKASNWLDGLI
ncbi:pyruvate dehydrogenase X component [Mycena rebaudengoi]|nr:pyruvate dehydrogenase X component [Mycena rebaudengoi]